jgi:hypothetical protein
MKEAKRILIQRTTTPWQLLFSPFRSLLAFLRRE